MKPGDLVQSKAHFNPTMIYSIDHQKVVGFLSLSNFCLVIATKQHLTLGYKYFFVLTNDGTLGWVNVSDESVCTI